MATIPTYTAHWILARAREWPRVQVQNVREVVDAALAAADGVDRETAHLCGWWLLERLTMRGARRLAMDAGMSAARAASAAAEWQMMLATGNAKAAAVTVGAIENFRPAIGLERPALDRAEMSDTALDLVQGEPEPQPKAAPIFLTTAEVCIQAGLAACSIPPADKWEVLGGKSRTRVLVDCRGLIVTLMRRFTLLSYPQIAVAMRIPNHSSTIGSHRRFEALLKADSYEGDEARSLLFAGTRNARAFAKEQA